MLMNCLIWIMLSQTQVLLHSKLSCTYPRIMKLWSKMIIEGQKSHDETRAQNRWTEHPRKQPHTVSQHTLNRMITVHHTNARDSRLHFLNTKESWEKNHQNLIAEEMDEFGEVGVEMSYIQTQTHSDHDSGESSADLDLEDGEWRKMLALLL